MENSIQSAKTRPGADHGSDHQLFIAKFRLKLKKIGETTRPFRNQIPYDYTGDDEKIQGTRSYRHRVPEELWTEVCNIVQEVFTKTIPKKKKRKKVRQLSEAALQIAEIRDIPN